MQVPFFKVNPQNFEKIYDFKEAWVKISVKFAFYNVKLRFPTLFMRIYDTKCMIDNNNIKYNTK